MAEIIERHFMDPGTLTVEGDVHRGLTGFGVRGSKVPRYRGVREGELTPVAHAEDLPNKEAQFSGTINTNAIDAINLQNTSPDGPVTMEGVDGLTGTAMTVTMTAVTFGGFSANPTRENPGQSSLEFEATTFVVV